MLTAINGRIQGREVAVAFDRDHRHLLIVGDNGSGKDAISRVVQLALTGGSDDLLNRGTGSPSGEPVRALGDLSYLLSTQPTGPQDGLICHVEFTAVDGGVVEAADFTLTVNAKGNRERGWTLPATVAQADAKATSAVWWVLPMREIYRHLAAGPDRARTFFLPYIVGGNIQELVSGALGEAGCKLLTDAGVSIPETAEALLDRVDGLETSASEAVEASRAADAAAELRRRDLIEARPTADRLTAAAAGVQLASKRARDLRDQRVLAAGQTAWKQEDLAGLRQRVMTAATTIAENRQWLEQQRTYIPQPLPPYPPFQPSNPGAAQALAYKNWRLAVMAAGASAAEAGLQIPFCPCCGAGGEAARADTLAQWDQQARVALDATSAEYTAWEEAGRQWQAAEDRRRAMETAFSQWTQEFEARVRAHADLQADLSQREQAGALQQPEQTATVSDEDVANAERAEAEAVEAQRRLQALNQQWVEADIAKEAAQALTLRATANTTLIDALRRAVESILEQHLDDFLKRVNRWMPAKWPLRIFLRDPEADGRRVFRLGVQDGATGSVVMALSGGQRLAAMMAIAQVLLEHVGRSYPTGGAVIMAPDETTWHPNTLAEVMKTLAPCTHSIVLLASVAPTTTPEGWLVVDAAQAAQPVTAGDSALLTQLPRGKGKASGTGTGSSTRKRKNDAPAASVAADPAQSATVTGSPDDLQLNLGAQAASTQAEPTAEMIEEADLRSLGWTPGKIRNLIDPTVRAQILRDRLQGVAWMVIPDGGIQPIPAVR